MHSLEIRFERSNICFICERPISITKIASPMQQIQSLLRSILIERHQVKRLPDQENANEQGIWIHSTRR